MRSITGNKLASYKPKQDVFASLHELTKTKHNRDRPFIYQYQVGGRGGGLNKNVLGEKNRKIN